MSPILSSNSITSTNSKTLAQCSRSESASASGPGAPTSSKSIGKSIDLVQANNRVKMLTSGNSSNSSSLRLVRPGLLSSQGHNGIDSSDSEEEGQIQHYNHSNVTASISSSNDFNESDKLRSDSESLSVTGTSTPSKDPLSESDTKSNKKQLTNLNAMFLLFSGAMGTGILTLPTVIQHNGYVIGGLLILGGGVLSAASEYYLIKATRVANEQRMRQCLEDNEEFKELTTFSELMEHAVARLQGKNKTGTKSTVWIKMSLNILFIIYIYLGTIVASTVFSFSFVDAILKVRPEDRYSEEGTMPKIWRFLMTADDKVNNGTNGNGDGKKDGNESKENGGAKENPNENGNKPKNDTDQIPQSSDNFAPPYLSVYGLLILFVILFALCSPKDLSILKKVSLYPFICVMATVIFTVISFFVISPKVGFPGTGESSSDSTVFDYSAFGINVVDPMPESSTPNSNLNTSTVTTCTVSDLQSLQTRLTTSLAIPYFHFDFIAILTLSTRFVFAYCTHTNVVTVAAELKDTTDKAAFDISVWNTLAIIVFYFLISLMCAGVAGFDLGGPFTEWYGLQEQNGIIRDVTQFICLGLFLMVIVGVAANFTPINQSCWDLYLQCTGKDVCGENDNSDSKKSKSKSSKSGDNHTSITAAAAIDPSNDYDIDSSCSDINGDSSTQFECSDLDSDPILKQQIMEKKLHYKRLTKQLLPKSASAITAGAKRGKGSNKSDHSSKSSLKSQTQDNVNTNNTNEMSTLIRLLLTAFWIGSGIVLARVVGKDINVVVDPVGSTLATFVMFPAPALMILGILNEKKESSTSASSRATSASDSSDTNSKSSMMWNKIWMWIFFLFTAFMLTGFLLQQFVKLFLDPETSEFAKHVDTVTGINTKYWRNEEAVKKCIVKNVEEKKSEL